ncbi:TPA: hypothetical protein ACX6Q6_003540 [Photobacterium damselae]
MKLKPLLATIVLIAAATNADAQSYGDVYLDSYQHDSQTYGIEGGYYNQDLNFYGFSEMSSLGSNFTKGELLYEPSHFYAQTSYFKQDNATTTTTVIGSGVLLNCAGFSLQPFIGVEVGKHVGMIGWSSHVTFGNVTLSHWNESEVSKTNYLNSQGAFGVFYDITPRLGTGLQYRYYWNMDDTHHYDANFIYRVYYKL